MGKKVEDYPRRRPHLYLWRSRSVVTCTLRVMRVWKAAITPEMGTDQPKLFLYHPCSPHSQTILCSIRTHSTPLFTPQNGATLNVNNPASISSEEMTDLDTSQADPRVVGPVNEGENAKFWEKPNNSQEVNGFNKY